MPRLRRARVALLLATSSLAAAEPAAPDAMTSSANAFAAALYGDLRSRSGNIAVSPASLWLALLMTRAGARGSTGDEMSRVLHVQANGDVDAKAAALLDRWGKPVGGVELRVANRLFGEKTYRFEAPYLERTRTAYGAPLEPVDFRGDANGARTHINGWVATQTRDRIKDLLPAGSVDDQTRLVLTNAVYFLAKWEEPFEKTATNPAPFKVGGGRTVTVPTMHAVGFFSYAETDSLQVLEKPYQGGEFAMGFVLPKDDAGLGAVEGSLDAAAVDRLFASLSSERVSVSLPKVRIDPPESLAVGDALARLGMPTALDRRRADFTGIANPPDPDDRLFVSKVFHKAFVAIDEEGTEAAAASAVVMARAGSAAPSKLVVFNADHPFLFFLRDLRSGLILFAGRVADPSGS
ncbi:MAG: serpin family protein [Acidobacteriota bacterium]